MFQLRHIKNRFSIIVFFLLFCLCFGIHDAYAVGLTPPEINLGSITNGQTSSAIVTLSRAVDEIGDIYLISEVQEGYESITSGLDTMVIPDGTDSVQYSMSVTPDGSLSGSQHFIWRFFVVDALDGDQVTVKRGVGVHVYFTAAGDIVSGGGVPLPPEEEPQEPETELVAEPDTEQEESVSTVIQEEVPSVVVDEQTDLLVEEEQLEEQKETTTPTVESDEHGVDTFEETLELLPDISLRSIPELIDEHWINTQYVLFDWTKEGSHEYEWYYFKIVRLGEESQEWLQTQHTQIQLLLNDGEYEFFVYAENANGQSRIVSKIVRIDTIVPALGVIRAQGYKRNWWVFQKPYVFFTVEDKLSGIQGVFIGSDEISMTGNEFFFETPQKTGKYEWSVQMLDNAGNISITKINVLVERKYFLQRILSIITHFFSSIIN